MKKEDLVKRRVVHFVFGICFTILFIIFAIISISVAPHSSDIGDDYNMLQNYHRGVEREVTVTPEPVATTAPVEEASVQPEAEATAATEAVAAETASEPVRPEVERARALNLPDPPEIDTTSWEYMLINYDHLLDQDYKPSEFAYLNLTMDETDIQTGTDDYSATRCLVDSRIGEALRNFALACKEQNLPVYLSSGYRGYVEQNTLYQRKIGQYNADVAKYIVAEPGTSEHQSGLCCDITDRYHELKDASLEDTDTYKWLYAHCAEFGFILRYPKDKSGSSDDLYSVSETVTQVIYEPWHFRYVGTEAAQYIMDNNLCLEEFLALYDAL